MSNNFAEIESCFCLFEVHECLFCPQTFGNATEKDDHTLEHFAQETCTDCNQNLIRIGGNLYVLHNVVTCIRRELKTERHSESCVVGHSLPSNEQQKEFFYIHSIHPAIRDEIQLKSEVKTEHSSDGDGLPNSVPIVIPPIDPIECTLESSNLATNCFDGVEVKVEPEEIQPLDVELVPMDIPEPKPNHSTVERKRQKNHNSKRERTAMMSKSQTDETLKNVAPRKCNERTNEKCNLCGQIFYNKHSLRGHKVRKHSADDAIFCHRCATIFSTVDELQIHQNYCLSKFKKYRQKQLKRIQKIEDENRRKFECYMCKHRMYKYKQSVDKHMRRNHPTPDDQLNDIKFMCNICGKFLSSHGSFAFHMQAHTGEKPYKCTHDGCDMMFSSVSNRNAHVKSHIDPKPHACTVDGCTERFTRPMFLQRHKFKAHGIPFIESFPCIICNAIFPAAYLLKIHMRKHINVD